MRMKFYTRSFIARNLEIGIRRGFENSIWWNPPVPQKIKLQNSDLEIFLVIIFYFYENQNIIMLILHFSRFGNLSIQSSFWTSLITTRKFIENVLIWIFYNHPGNSTLLMTPNSAPSSRLNILRLFFSSRRKKYMW